MYKSNVSQVKKERKKSFLLREISVMLQKIAMDEPKIVTLFPTKIDLSADGGICYIFLSTFGTEEEFYEGLEVLKLYKPSIRNVLAKKGHSRYVPDIVFRYYKTKEKERKINALLDDVCEENNKS